MSISVNLNKISIMLSYSENRSSESSSTVPIRVNDQTRNSASETSRTLWKPFGLTPCRNAFASMYLSTTWPQKNNYRTKIDMEFELRIQDREATHISFKNGCL